MDIRKVKKLIELLESSDIAEIEIKEGEESVRISRGSISMPAPMAHQRPAAPAAVPTLSAVAPAAAAPAEGNAIKSPMVGTFYRSSAPGEKVFVEEGQQV